MNKSKSIIILLIYFISTLSVHSLEADVFVQSTVNRASKILSENISKDEKIEKLKIVAKETVDIRGIGFYTLGAERKNLSDEEKKKYSILFEKYFLKSLIFLKRFFSYSVLKIPGSVVFDNSILSSFNSPSKMFEALL